MEGILVKYQKDTNDSLFFAGLKKEVKNYFLIHNKKDYGNGNMVAKIIFFFLLFFGSYGLLISNQFSPTNTLLLGIVCGLSSIFLVFNIAHDASHNCLFKSRKLNKILSYTFNLVGGNAHVWNVLHNQTHHASINVSNTDPDIYLAAPYIRVSPADPFKPYHRYQHFYATAIYLTHSLYHIFIKDFMVFGILPNKAYSFPVCTRSISSYFVLITSKILYLLYSLAIPLLILDIIWWKIILGYLFIQFLMGFLLSIVSIPVHIADWNNFPVIDKDHKIEQSWVRSIFESTVDYSYRSKIANFFFGGLNTHLAHHLFPNVCHIHLIEVTKIIEAQAQQHSLTYRNVSMWEAIKAHYRHLKKMSRPSHNKVNNCSDS